MVSSRSFFCSRRVECNMGMKSEAMSDFSPRRKGLYELIFFETGFENSILRKILELTFSSHFLGNEILDKRILLVSLVNTSSFVKALIKIQ